MKVIRGTSHPSITTRSLKRNMSFEFDDGVIMTLDYVAVTGAPSVTAGISGVVSKDYVYRHNCPNGETPVDGKMDAAAWGKIAIAFRNNLEVVQ